MTTNAIFYLYYINLYMSSKNKEEIIIIYDTDDEKKDIEAPKIKLNYVYLIHLTAISLDKKINGKL